ncbi:MAG: hypothetical protein RML56_08750 [Burkholderiales bacterium]|nr:hypothetical protein [Burkholderiales bacterium]
MRAIYEQMRKNAAADDITPELYLYAALEEHRLYEHMQAAAEEMLRRQPGDEAAAALLEWARERSRQSKRPPAR